jgi:hypothetical protein
MLIKANLNRKRKKQSEQKNKDRQGKIVSDIASLPQ